MSLFTRCIFCNGSGRMMGGGMMIKDCVDCDGSGKIPVQEPKQDEEFFVEKIKTKRGRPRRIENE